MLLESPALSVATKATMHLIVRRGSMLHLVHLDPIKAKVVETDNVFHLRHQGDVSTMFMLRKLKKLPTSYLVRFSSTPYPQKCYLIQVLPIASPPKTLLKEVT